MKPRRISTAVTDKERVLAAHPGATCEFRDGLWYVRVPVGRGRWLRITNRHVNRAKAWRAAADGLQGVAG